MNFRPEKFGHNKTRDHVDSKEEYFFYSVCIGNSQSNGFWNNRKMVVKFYNVCLVHVRG